MRFIIWLGLSILLSSCATTTDNYYTRTITSWRGGHVNTLVQRWGMPDEKITRNNGESVYLYKTTSYRTYGGPASPSIGVHLSPTGEPVIITEPNTNNVWNRSLRLDCITIFTVSKNGVITNVKSQGPVCYGGESFANRMANPR